MLHRIPGAEQALGPMAARRQMLDRDFRDEAVTTEKIADDTIVTANFGDGAVQGEHLIEPYNAQTGSCRCFNYAYRDSERSFVGPNWRTADYEGYKYSSSSTTALPANSLIHLCYEFEATPGAGTFLSQEFAFWDFWMTGLGATQEMFRQTHPTPEGTWWFIQREVWFYLPLEIYGGFPFLFRSRGANEPRWIRNLKVAYTGIWR
jgi:hypothetical protein